MALIPFRDTLSLVKQDGSRTSGIQASVQKDKIFIHRSDIAIEKDDLLIRIMPHGGVEEYIVIEPNFMHGFGSIPSGYQAEVKLRNKANTNKTINPASTAAPETIISLVQSFFSLCITIVNEDASYPEKHITAYHTLRLKILELENIIVIPQWIRFSQNPLAVKNHIGLNIDGGSGGWDRRRKYLQAEMVNMLSSYNNLSATGHSVSESTIKKTEKISGLTTMGSNSLSIVKKKVFIVHGHDDQLKNEVFVFLTKEGFEPVILHHEINEGLTIIEKLEKHTSMVSYAVVLYTSCDKGKAKDDAELSARARQNVVFEHGWLISKLSRKNVAAIVEEGVEFPGDLHGLVRIPKSEWKYQLSKELGVIK